MVGIHSSQLLVVVSDVANRRRLKKPGLMRWVSVFTENVDWADSMVLKMKTQKMALTPSPSLPKTAVY